MLLNKKIKISLNTWYWVVESISFRFVNGLAKLKFISWESVVVKTKSLAVLSETWRKIKIANSSLLQHSLIFSDATKCDTPNKTLPFI